MAAPRLYCRDLHPGQLQLCEEESRHAGGALRLQPGDEVTIFDGAGREAGGTIAVVTRRSVEVMVHEVTSRVHKPDRRLTLAVALPRAQRQGFMVEKCTEMGVFAMWPIVAQRSVVKPRDSVVDKLRRRALEACKQSGRAWLPEICVPAPVEQLWRRAAEFDLAVLAVARGKSELFAAQVLALPATASIIVWIGPEGGWSESELEAASDTGIASTSLGSNVLRLETAAVAACAIVNALGEWP